MQERFAEGVKKAKTELKRWDEYLAADPQYIVGSALSLADIALALTLFFAMRGGAKLEEFTHLRKYAESMKGREIFAETWPPHWKDSENKDWLVDV